MSHSNLIKIGVSSDLSSHGLTSPANPDNTDLSVNHLAGEMPRVSSYGLSSATLKSGEVTHDTIDTQKRDPSDEIRQLTNNNTESAIHFKDKSAVSNSPASPKYTIPVTAVSSRYTIPDASQQQMQSKQNDDEISYSLCRGIITLLDGSNKEIRACTECHRQRSGVELCRLARLHSGADWNDERDPPGRIHLPAGKAFKRVGSATDSALKPIIGGQNRKPASVPAGRSSHSNHRQNGHPNKPPVIHPITSLAAKFQLAGRQFRELSRPPWEDEEKPVDQLTRLEQRVDEMQANVTSLLSMTQKNRVSSSSATADIEKVSSPTSDSTLGDMGQFFVSLKDKITAAKANRQTVKEIVLFAEVSIHDIHILIFLISILVTKMILIIYTDDVVDL